MSIDQTSAVVTPRGRARRTRGAEVTVELQVLLVLGALVAYFSISYPGTFASVDNLENMARVAGILLVVSIGQMFALVIGGFDISVGATMGFAATVAALGMTEWGGGLGTGLLLGVGAGAAVGLVNGILVAWVGVTPFIATLGMLTFLAGFANELSGGVTVAGLPEGFRNFGGGSWGPIPSAVGIAAVISLLVWFVLTRTRAGLYLYSIGGGREASRVAGVSVARYEMLAYTACGLFAGIAGVMLASRVAVGQPSLGAEYGLLSIATAVIGGVAIGGGLGRLSGVLLGVALITVLTTGMDIAGVGTFVQQMVQGAVLVIAVVMARVRGVAVPGLRVRRRRADTNAGSPNGGGAAA